MAIPIQRDQEQTAAVLAEWLRTKIDDARDVAVSNLSAPPSSGFSNETIMFDATWSTGRGDRCSAAYVVRIEPTGYRVFLESDFRQQYELLRVLDRDTDVPVPHTLWFEADDQLLGAPFFVMDKVAGQAAPDSPPYNREGWLHETGPHDRYVLWRSAIDALITVHQVATELVAFIAKPELGDTGFDQVVEYWRRSWVWAAGGEEYPVAAAALEWLDANLPQRRPTALSWGDARIGNLLFHDGAVQAVVDWEMMSLGGHEMDLGWWLFLDQYHCFDMPRLEGLGSREETIACWEAGTGESSTDLEWYEVFAGFRFAVVLMRIGQMYESFGVSRQDRGDMERNNPVLHLLAAKLDIEPPGPLSRTVT